MQLVQKNLFETATTTYLGLVFKFKESQSQKVKPIEQVGTIQSTFTFLFCLVAGTKGKTHSS